MTPTAAILDALGHPVLLVVALFLKWWAIWFTLGHFFRRTTMLLVAAVACSWAVSQLLVLSGAVGMLPVGGEPGYAPHLSWLSWVVAVATVWAGLGTLEALILRMGMRQSQRATWKWRRSDLWVYLGWHGLIVLIATWMASGLFL